MKHLTTNKKESKMKGITPSQIKTIKLMTEVHNGGWGEILPCGDVKLIVPPICPDLYKREALIISRRGKVVAEYLTTHSGDKKRVSY